MKATFDVYRKKPGAVESYRQKFLVEVAGGTTVLDVFHVIQARFDPSFAYRYSCRGAICGSCAVRINGTAALACKTQALPLAEQGTVMVDPLANMPVVKDLVGDFVPFWEAFEKVRPFIEREREQHDASLTWEDKMPARNLDQLSRCVDCIKCASCFSDCPKRAMDPTFIGPAACVELYKFYYDPRDAAHEQRVQIARGEGGVFACDSYSNCVESMPEGLPAHEGHQLHEAGPFRRQVAAQAEAYPCPRFQEDVRIWPKNSGWRKILWASCRSPRTPITGSTWRGPWPTSRSAAAGSTPR